MERLKQMKETLMGCVQGQLSNLQNADSKELGEAIDMIKDLDEALYYCSIVKAMEDSKKEQEVLMKNRYYTPYYYEYPYDYNRQNNRLYYTGGRNGGRGSYGYLMERESRYPQELMRDRMESRSEGSRRAYMESKEMHKGKEVEMQELDRYMQELAVDITEMIADATAEEKVMLQQKLNNLATKIK